MVLIASCYYQRNYGSMLQALATQEILNKYGIENQTINCRKINQEVKKSKLFYYFKKIYKIDSFLAQVKRFTFNYRIRNNKELKENVYKRITAFDHFIDKFDLTDSCSLNELDELCKSTDAKAVIVGSDQLWLPSNINADFYTLNHISGNVKKISYATSFGVSKLDPATAKLASFLNKFSYVSVREDAGVKMVEEITDHKAALVCDPTILFTAEEWRKILKINSDITKKYILCYFLGNNPWHREWAKKLKEETGLKIISLIHLETYIKSDCGYADETPFDVDPAGFVELISNAEYVCTDSFHGMVFSLIFNKKFFSFKRFSDKHSASTNSRIYSLLSPLGLTDRIIEKDTSVSVAVEMDYDYNYVEKYFSDFRKNSVEWLKNSLGELYNEESS